MEPIDVIEIGAEVFVGDDIPARILAVTIGEGYVAYKCAWWHEGQRNVDWISSPEVTVKRNTLTRQVRFRQ